MPGKAVAVLSKKEKKKIEIDCRGQMEWMKYLAQLDNW
jgi:hypothetical protein